MVISVGLIILYSFSFLHLYTFYCSVFTLLPLSPTPLTHTGPPPLGRNYSALLFSNFVGGKREKIKRKT
jgi:hypothetical protein